MVQRPWSWPLWEASPWRRASGPSQRAQRPGVGRVAVAMWRRSAAASAMGVSRSKSSVRRASRARVRVRSLEVDGFEGEAPGAEAEAVGFEEVERRAVARRVVAGQVVWKPELAKTVSFSRRISVAAVTVMSGG